MVGVRSCGNILYNIRKESEMAKVNIAEQDVSGRDSGLPIS